jgi:hypothetical protein
VTLTATTGNFVATYLFAFYVPYRVAVRVVALALLSGGFSFGWVVRGVWEATR